MKMIPHLSLGALLLSVLFMTGCESARTHERTSGSGQTDFDRKTQQAYNPETQNYEKQPPYGPRSNKPVSN